MGAFFAFFVAETVLFVVIATVKLVRWARAAESADGVRNRALYGGFVIVGIIVVWVVMGTTFMAP